jgi:acyl-CoA synthetase (AMP-forming)/AMP-acid ligase II
MNMKRAIVADPSISLVRGLPLSEEPGLGALTIPGYLSEVCEKYGDAEAVVLHRRDGVERWSYRELQARSMAVAKALIACGVGKDSRVGVLMTNRCEYLSAVFGIAMAGGVIVALSTFSTATEMEYLLKASSISVLLFEDRVLKKDFGAMLADLEPAIRDSAVGEFSSSKFPYLKHFVKLVGVTAEGEDGTTGIAAYESWENFIARGNAVSAAIVEARSASVTPADAGGLFFSSGTTSLPKGILHSQRAFAIQWWRWPRVMSVKEPARAWTGNGFFWSGNIAMIVGVALATGGAIILQPLFDAEEAVRLIQSERVNFVSGRPHQWARMQAAPGYAEADLSTLRYITRGEILMEHPTVNTDWDLPMSFGTTETMTIMTSYDSDTPAAQYAGSCGVPLPGNLLKIVNPETGVPVPVGERGEICIKGPTLMSGYIGKTIEECFDDEGFYRTGDGGYVDMEGRLFWEGRITAMIKTGGANVSPEEVDDVIAKYPGVKRTQTVGVPHPTLTEIVVACIVPVEGTTLDTAALIAFLKEQLASFKVPREVLLFKEEEFALTGNEKVKVGEIRQAAMKRLGITT